MDNNRVNSMSNRRINHSNSMLPTPSTQLYYISAVAPSVLVGFFILLSIFNQNLKGLAYLVGVCVLLQMTNVVNNMATINKPNPESMNHKTCKFVSSFNGLPYGMQIYAFTLFYLLLPMMTNGIHNIPLLFTIVFLMIVDGSMNINQGCSTLQYIAISLIMGGIIGTIWSLIIYSVRPGLTYHTDYITSNKLACQMPSKQNFKCVVKKNGEIIG